MESRLRPHSSISMLFKDLVVEMAYISLTMFFFFISVMWLCMFKKKVDYQPECEMEIRVKIVKLGGWMYVYFLK